MGKIRFEIDGLNLDRLINKLEDNNIGIENVEKSDYNKMVKTCPSNFVALLNHYSTKEYFDGNKIEDDNEMVKL